MTQEELNQHVEQIKKSGPVRILLDRTGKAVPPRRAREVGSPPPDIILIRRDGWSIGAPVYLWSNAQALWPDEWEAILLRKGDQWELRNWEQYERLLEMATDVLALRDARRDVARDTELTQEVKNG